MDADPGVRVPLGVVGVWREGVMKAVAPERGEFTASRSAARRREGVAGSARGAARRDGVTGTEERGAGAADSSSLLESSGSAGGGGSRPSSCRPTGTNGRDVKLADGVPSVMERARTAACSASCRLVGPLPSPNTAMASSCLCRASLSSTSISASLSPAALPPGPSLPQPPAMPSPGKLSPLLDGEAPDLPGSRPSSVASGCSAAIAMPPPPLKVKGSSTGSISASFSSSVSPPPRRRSEPVKIQPRATPTTAPPASARRPAANPQRILVSKQLFWGRGMRPLAPENCAAAARMARRAPSHACPRRRGRDGR
ncbi:hypothetical protein T484DRAFT_1964536 [Baffinella frigidus]|nr:hypothetical protein T484DRAFT_1964536 [Cryptophyta sp. CCMP2293]